MTYFTEEQERQWRAQQPKKMIGAKVVVKSVDGRILLVKPSYKPTWQLPGGVVEADESPVSAAVRELYEEVGIKCHEGDLTLIDTIFRPTQDVLILLYELVEPQDNARDITIQATELEAYEWIDTGEVAQRLPAHYSQFWQRYATEK
jgi:ADP-ribose pyrophosphatase YjhB (NUDIX family)